MGAWGQTPFDNDDFADMFYGLRLSEPITKALNKVLVKAERGDDSTEKWAAVGMVIWAYNTGAWWGGGWPNEEFDSILATCNQLLEIIEHDDEWMKSWRSGTNIRKFVHEAKELLSEMSGRHETPVLPDMLSEMFSAQRSRPVPKRRKR